MIDLGYTNGKWLVNNSFPLTSGIFCFMMGPVFDIEDTQVNKILVPALKDFRVQHNGSQDEF